jgi:hypothetical protein
MSDAKCVIGEFRVGEKVELCPVQNLNLPPNLHVGDQLTVEGIANGMLYFKEIFGGWYAERFRSLRGQLEYKYCVVTLNCFNLPLAGAIQRAKEMTKVDNLSRMVIEQGKVAGIAELVSIVEYTPKK